MSVPPTPNVATPPFQRNGPEPDEPVICPASLIALAKLCGGVPRSVITPLCHRNARYVVPLRLEIDE
jgi:hypothetical protein